MSRRGSDAKARDRRHRAAVAQRSESSARSLPAVGPAAPAPEVCVKPFAAAQPAAASPEKTAVFSAGRGTSPRRQKDHRPRHPVAAAELVDLRDLVSAREAAALAVDSEIRRLRRLGVNWPEIANALGVSRQAARQRYLPRA